MNYELRSGAKAPLLSAKLRVGRISSFRKEEYPNVREGEVVGRVIIC
jgi:hypothetical protein